MHIFGQLIGFGMVLALGACGDTFTPEAKRADAIKSFNLTTAQVDIMDAYLEGITKTKAEPAMVRRFTRIAACYADQVDMPDKYDVPHRAYIRDFEAIEKNYYPWFQSRGIGQDAAYDIGQRVRKAADKCHLIVRR